MLADDAIHCGDSVSLLKEHAAKSGKPIDLIFADPPFNIGYVYDKYHDDRLDEEYVQWTKDWMKACVGVLKPTGSFYIAIGDEFAADIRIIGRELGLHLRNWIIWHYTFGQNTQTKFARSHTHIFYFTKDPKAFTFNDQLLRFPSARHTEYQDLRASPNGRLPNDVWREFPRVCGTFREREGFHGCQMPAALLMRIILASSNPGEIVLDPFIGSGTTAAAAKRLGRRYIGIDLSPEYVEHVRQRLSRVTDESALPANPRRWPALHTDVLAQIYRETGVALHNLERNSVALGVVARSLTLRTGAEYSIDAILVELARLKAAVSLPKLPNDAPFIQRNHVTAEGKKYERIVFRVRGRKTHDGRRKRDRIDGPGDETLAAM